MQLEDEKLEELRSWGRRLRSAPGDERAAAGRAILMLIEEIERLRLELLRTPEQSTRELDGNTDETLTSTLRERLPQTAARAEASPEAWIESLRRQE